MKGPRGSGYDQSGVPSTEGNGRTLGGGEVLGIGCNQGVRWAAAVVAMTALPVGSRRTPADAVMLVLAARRPISILTCKQARLLQEAFDCRLLMLVGAAKASARPTRQTARVWPSSATAPAWRTCLKQLAIVMLSPRRGSHIAGTVALRGHEEAGETLPARLLAPGLRRPFRENLRLFATSGDNHQRGGSPGNQERTGRKRGQDWPYLG